MVLKGRFVRENQGICFGINLFNMVLKEIFLLPCVIISFGISLFDIVLKVYNNRRLGHVPIIAVEEILGVSLHKEE